jgi:hypothetical protein
MTLAASRVCSWKSEETNERDENKDFYESIENYQQDYGSYDILESILHYILHDQIVDRLSSVLCQILVLLLHASS